MPGQGPSSRRGRRKFGAQRYRYIYIYIYIHIYTYIYIYTEREREDIYIYIYIHIFHISTYSNTSRVEESTVKSLEDRF